MKSLLIHHIDIQKIQEYTIRKIPMKVIHFLLKIVLYLAIIVRLIIKYVNRI
jgi:hypothetical protein